MSGALNTVATIFGIGIVGYFAYKVILPKLNELGNAPAPSLQFPSSAAAAAPAPQMPASTPTNTNTLPELAPEKKKEKEKEPEQQQQPQAPAASPIVPTSHATSPNVPGTALTFNVVGDIDDNALAAATATNLCGGNPTVTLIIGDFAYHCNAQKWWTGSMKACNGKQNVLGSVGNHDCNGKGFLELFPANKGQWEFTHKIGNIAFIAVNTGFCNAQCMDLKSEALFQQAQNDPSVKFIVAHFHKPIFTTGTPPDAPMSLHLMMKKYPKVKMAFAGHNHSYRRYVPIDGIQYITAGAGGHDKTAGSPVVKGPSSGSVGVVKCRVSADGSMTCQYVANSGEVLDSWGLTAEGKHTGSGGVTPGQKAPASAYAQAQSFYAQLNPHDYPDKEARDNAFLKMMDMRHAMLHPQRKFNNKIYHYSARRRF